MGLGRSLCVLREVGTLARPPGVSCASADTPVTVNVLNAFSKVVSGSGVWVVGIPWTFCVYMRRVLAGLD